MCQFLSAIVTRNKKIICDPLIDSHEILIKKHNLCDNGAGHFVRVEFIPKDGKYNEPETYTLKLDEREAPVWWDDALAFDVAEDLRERIAEIVLTGKHYGLIGGCYILHNADVELIQHCRIVSVTGKSKLGEIRAGGTVQKVWSGGTVQKVWERSRRNNHLRPPERKKI